MSYVALSVIALFVSLSVCLGDVVTMKIDAPLSREMAATRGSDQGIPVIITLEHGEDVESLMIKGIKPRIVYQNIPAVAATLTRGQIKDIAEMPQVKSIEFDSEAKALSKP
jgi:hypothetical protein